MKTIFNPRFLIPGLVLFFFLVFLVLLALQPDANREPPHPWARSLGTALALTFYCLLVTFAAWFLYCFTGKPDDKTNDAFMLAYAFTFISFLILVAPVLGLVKSANDQGFLSFVRGCAQATSTTSRSIYAPAVLCSDAPTPSPGVPPPVVPEAGRQHSQWLVAIGGVNGRVMSEEKSNSYTIVTDGLIVPLYVVILAFIGGAVSLSRRIPEYQKRADVHYVPTPEEPALKAFAARESVVFQIMQLISAPFIAITAFYVVEPASLSVAAGLAFASGFASEPILLIIRGMINGVKPVSLVVSSKPADLMYTTVSGSVTSGGKPLQGVDVTVDGLTIKAMSDADGRFLLAQVPLGKQKFVAAFAGKTGTVEVQISAKGNPQVDLVI